MKHPNGYGSVAKLSGNRRNPFVVRKTVGWSEKGYPIYNTIGYTPTREEGLILLAEYNRNPYDIDIVNMTMAELFERFKKTKMLKLAKQSQGSLKSAYNHCKPLHHWAYKDIRSFHMQECIDGCGRGYSTQGAIKSLFSHLDKLALELDVINKAYSQLTTSEPIPETTKRPFTDEEVTAVWGIQDQEWVDSVLFFLYTGIRISELINLESDMIDLNENLFKGGVKTKAGKNRIIPIHPKILPLVHKRMEEGNKYLFSLEGKRISSYQYYQIWYNIMESLNLNHKPHECRHTFRSRLDSAGANRVCINLLMGHKSKEVGERVYTHKTIAELKETIELLN